MLADILYGLLLFVCALAVIGVFRHIRSLRRSNSIPSEQLFILMFVLLLGVCLGYLLLNSQINKLDLVEDDQGHTEKQVFIEKLYPPLVLSQDHLNNQVTSLKSLQKQIVALRDEHPQQKERLQFSYSVWSRERKELVILKSDLDKAVHRAWSYRKTKDNSFVENKFSREAVDWDKAIKSRLSEYQESQLQVTNSMLDNVMLQRQNLSELVIGNKVIAKANATLTQSAFSIATVDKLVEALAIRSPKRVALLESMTQAISVAIQKRREVRNYALDKPNLQTALQRVMDDWFALERRSIYYRDQVLHAVQADYLARILGVNQRDNQIVRLEREINKVLPVLLNKLKASNVNLEKSYQLSPS
ncbi:hypothetical protein [Leucothrix arctica]|uniref:Uncharacterized protein n=1 Tax=Leucothrix arctica TaxID=1481894 RepID=A0A317C8G1_9GAMM|nr:hypothetical protein [Leucothrix arctica]PWQ94541.1 hypothetical protein DKT75_14690 [Leucothrix arctica]